MDRDPGEACYARFPVAQDFVLLDQDAVCPIAEFAETVLEASGVGF